MWGLVLQKGSLAICYLHLEISCAHRDPVREAAGKGQSLLSRANWTCSPLLSTSDLEARGLTESPLCMGFCKGSSTCNKWLENLSGSLGVLCKDPDELGKPCVHVWEGG